MLGANRLAVKRLLSGTKILVHLYTVIAFTIVNDQYLC